MKGWMDDVLYTGMDEWIDEGLDGLCTVYRDG